MLQFLTNLQGICKKRAKNSPCTIRFLISIGIAIFVIMGCNYHANAACETPNLLIILDKSGSMSGSKWTNARNAINTVTNNYRYKLRFGLETFHSSATINYGIDRCIRDGNNCVPNLQSILQGISASGGTSLIAAITTGHNHLQTVRNADSVKTRKMSVMFITDGIASCANTQVRTLRQQLGVDTYVIGFGSGIDANCLNNMAIEGGTALSGSRKYYQADNSNELNQAMQAIANAASKEICNGLDDDCNGIIDDPWPQKGQSCTVGIGACQRTGVWICRPDGTGIQCSVSPGSPTSERCNGIDDNCNGQIDENWPNKNTDCYVGEGSCRRKGTWVCRADGSGVECSARAGSPTKEICNGLDDDCDGVIDNGLTRDCSTACGPGMETCKNGAWVGCNAPQPQTERCNGRDDNCNGVIDDLWPQKGQSCKVGIGNCERVGKWVCRADGSGVECSATPGQPQPELCNGQDDDCNGKIDDPWPQKGTTCEVGVGACKHSGQWVCRADGSGVECSAKPGQPQPEICNGLDDDCNGLIDDNLIRDCSTACGPGQETCNNGKWINCNAPQPQKETCNGLDDNCNGIIDDPWPQLGTPCTVGVGACENTGVWQCNQTGDGVTCSVQPKAPQPEKCDGIDNNCNGQIDENWPDKGLPCNAGIGACEQNGKLVCKPDGSGLQCSTPGGSPSPEICDGIDNDCNGLIDDNLMRPCQTACGSGIEVCNKGTWSECTAPQPKPEICNNIDDDCDGQVDNGLTRVCETICGKGTETCISGRWVNCDAPQPKPEICDGKDNDCNGLIDNDIPPRKCTGDCGDGTATCIDGKWSGCSGPAPEPEICDGKDNDCNGLIDDNLSRPCNSACGSGTETCQNGQWVGCNAPQPEPEVCNGRDDDCDGVADNDAPCPSGMVCYQGTCRPRCRNGECPSGMQCVDDVCHGDSCSKVTCPSDQKCVGGRCIDPCELINCPSDYVCIKGKCVKNDCYLRGCPDGQRCVNGFCQSDPCANITCPIGQFCRDGQCVDSCANVTCPDKQKCIDGKCVDHPSQTGPCDGVTCPEGYICIEGKCKGDPCQDVTCPPGRQCKDGKCEHDPCHNITCPDGQICRDGQCYSPPSLPEPAPEEDPANGKAETPPMSVDGGQISDQTSTTQTDADLNTTEDRTAIDTSSGNPQTTTDDEPNRYAPGCGCQAAHTSPFLFLPLLLLAILFLRRRQQQG